MDEERYKIDEEGVEVYLIYNGILLVVLWAIYSSIMNHDYQVATGTIESAYCGDQVATRTRIFHFTVNGEAYEKNLGRKLCERLGPDVIGLHARVKYREDRERLVFGVDVGDGTPGPLTLRGQAFNSIYMLAFMGLFMNILISIKIRKKRSKS
ncbi:hypothetical protein [Isoalcanivorax indicus]|uniref:hypothetical protein n=1 Tax=Isoalcanivorax indicus TaxID=2202653 RepID=UPI0013C414DF|nr:hypothetical protein [Isoalcanivorax indicus]